jgi:hypothetical protein
LLPTGKTLKQDVSDSESYDDSSDDDSEYSDDDEAEPSPLPAARPDEMHGATRYDMIKAAWFPRKAQPSSDKIKASLRDVWEIFNTIQKRWRIDSKAVTEAEEQKKTKELPVLKSRVTSSRDLLQSALRAALDYAHPDVLYHIGQVKPFLYLCYLFLANRFKMQDYDGGLSTAIYEMLARCVGTLTTELLEETKVIKALNSMKKNANDKNKALIQQIIEGAAAGSKRAPSDEITVEPKTAKRPATQPLGRSPTEAPVAKKLKQTEPLANSEKKITTASKSSLAPGTQQQKRPGERVASIAAKPRGTQVVNKPSTLFASLSAASKKPVPSVTPTTIAKSVTKPATTTTTTKDKKATSIPAAKPAFSFAETMAQLLKPKEEEVAAPVKSEKQLPPETPAEKAKRLRKESRRHLRVTFKPDSSLVQIKYFHHDPEEESGHDENFVRDAGDIGGEGRMFKQHKDMMDEDDDEETEATYRPWKEPTLVDFSRIDPNDRKQNYEPYGGGESKPSCPEKETNIRREQTTLMVYYSHPSDIPASPREPLEQQSQPSAPATITNFGPPPDLVVSRAPKPSVPTTVPDLTGLESIFKQFAGSNTDTAQAAVPALMSYAPVPVAVAPAPAPAPVLDLASILSRLNQGQPQAQAVPYPPTIGTQPLDINAIMASLSGGATYAPPPPPPPGWPTLPIAFPQPQPDNTAVYQDQSQPQHDQSARGGHKRQRETNNDNDSAKGHGSSKRNKFDRDRPHKPHKVIPCRFFQKGMCSKGEDCTYIHDMNM